MIRKKTFMTVREAAQGGPYDERPMLPDEIDPQLHLSVNDRPQPFHLICEKDTMLVLVTGAGQVRFRESNVHFHPAEPGDFIYVPAGTPHRFVPDVTSVVHRYKPRRPGLEGIAWYCDGCDTELKRFVWDTETLVSQAAYQRYCEAFNDSETDRRCANCGAEHERIDLAPYRWAALAGELSPSRGDAA